MAALCAPHHALDSGSWQPASHSPTSLKDFESLRVRVRRCFGTTAYSRCSLDVLACCSYGRTRGMLLAKTLSGHMSNLGRAFI